MPLTLFSPLAVVDFEASSLEFDGYPIEVGVAVADRAAEKAVVWSALIRPTGTWTANGRWDRASERVHGITRATLDIGLTPRDAMLRLNELVAPIGRALCDGGPYDRFWLDSLARAASIRPAFQLWDLSEAFAFDRRALDRALHRLRSEPAPHRAGPDAARLYRALIDPQQGETE